MPEMMNLASLLRLILFAAAAGGASASAAAPNSNGFQITSIPNSAPITGGTSLFLHGDGDVPDGSLQCRFESTDARKIEASPLANWIDSKVHCIAPRWKLEGEVRLSLVLDGMEYSSTSFFYYAPPVIDEIYPSFGSVLGGTPVVVRGRGFHSLESAICRFGMMDVAVSWRSNEEIACVSPISMGVGTQEVSVGLNGVDFSLSVPFRYTDVTLVDSISTSMGSVEGGYVIVVQGRGFEDSEELSCVFRGIGSDSSVFVKASYQSPTELSCVAPAMAQHTAGDTIEAPMRQLIYVTVNGVDLSVHAVQFEFIDKAMISSIEPENGPVFGGTKIHVLGSGFVKSDSLLCHFDERKVVARYISTKEVECKLPPTYDGPGAVNITLGLNGVQFSGNEVEFEYYKQPAISAIQPEVGTAIGGTLVTLIAQPEVGSAFIRSSSIACRFGNVTVSGEYINQSRVSCRTPPQMSGLPHLVLVSINGVDFESSSIEFKYVDPDILSVSPTRGYVFGGAKIRVTGSRFEDTNQLACVFQRTVDESVIVSAAFMSSTEVECISPEMAEPGQVSVKVSLNGVDVSFSTASFAYIRPANISSLIPSSGSISGTAKVHLVGTGFLDGESVGCRFGETTVPAEWVSSAIVICKPISLNPSSPGYATVSYTNDGVHYMDAESQFLFVQLPSVTDVSPKSGLRSGGTFVRIMADEFTAISDWKCAFGGRQVSAKLATSSELECESPSSQEDLVPFKLILKDHDLDVDAGVFQYYDEIEIVSIFPESTPTAGGTPINITLWGLRSDSLYVCSFGNLEVSATVINDTLLVCDSPQLDRPETTTLAVHSITTSTELSLASDSVPFTVYQQPVIERVHPTIFYARYPTDVTIVGHGFIDSKQMKCRINNIDMLGQLASDDEIVCLASKVEMGRPVRGNLFFAANGVDFADLGIELRMLPDFAISSISPVRGSLLGDIDVKIIGIGFHASIQYRCLFGHIIVGAEFINSTSLSCTTPYVPRQGPKMVSICIETGDCTDTNMTYTFVEPLQLTHVEPRSGLLEGGTVVRVKANHSLKGHSYCWFGEVKVKLESDPDDNFGGTCTSPSFEDSTDMPKAVSFYVSTEGHHYSQGSFHFIYRPVEKTVELPTFANSTWPSRRERYAEKLSIKRITPAVLVRGSPSSVLVVEGHNFLDGGDFHIHSCLVNSSIAPAILHNESLEFQCSFTDLPDAGSYPVQFLTRQFGNITARNANIRVIDNPTLYHLEPPFVIARDPIDVVVKGENFVNHNLTCFVDDRAYEAIYISSSHIICPVPGNDVMASTYNVRVTNDGHFVPTSSLSLEVLAVPFIAELNPPLGLPGSNITLRGQSFHPKMKCYAPGIGGMESHFINSTTISCSLPFGHHAGSLSISLVLYEGVAVTSAQNFDFVNLGVQSIHPTFGSISGGTPVAFSMNEQSIRAISHCKFGDKVVSAAIVDGQLVCETPMTKAGLVRVGVGLNEEEFTMSGHMFEFHPIPTFSGIDPSVGLESGGNIVELQGDNFVTVNNISCYFDDAQAIGRWVSEEKVLCTTPTLEPKPYNVQVSFNGIDLIHTSLLFHVRPQMTTTRAEPSFGTLKGGTQIQVFGTNFQEDSNLHCRFGKISINAIFIGSNVLECATPPWDVAEVVDLGIVAESGDISLVESGFEYLAPFEVISVTPDNGFVRGGTLLSVRGTGFDQARVQVHCIIGSSAVPAIILSDSELSCSTPPTSELGQEDISIAHGADVFRFSSHFSYDKEILLYDVQPTVMTSERESLIVIRGSFFKQNRELACKLDPGLLALEASYVSDTEIVCRLPQGQVPQEYILRVSNNGQDYSDSSVTFRVMDPVKVYSLEPSMGSLGTTTSVLLRGFRFEEFRGLACIVDEKYIVTSHYIDSSSIRCVLPRGISTGTVSVSLAADGVSISNPHNFTFMNLDILSIQPNLGSLQGGTPVAIRLEQVSVSVVSHCKFGDTVVSVVVKDELLCPSPPAKTTGPVFIGLSMNGRDFATSRQKFEYFQPPKVTSVFPINGPEKGGTAVRLSGSNFINSSELLCYFDDTSVTGQWVTDEEIVCMTPKLKPGSYSIQVSMNSVDVIQSLFSFRVDKEVDVVMAKPALGVYSGTNVTVIGKSFIPTQQLYCLFGDYGIVGATYIGPSEITCQSPEIEVGSEDEVVEMPVRISLNGLDFSASSAPFRIIPLAEVRSMHPDKGPVSGGTQIVVKGMHFISNEFSTPMCIFGADAVPATIFSSTELICLTPPAKSDGEVPLTVSMNGVDNAKVGATFLYLPEITTLSVEPVGGPFTGGTLVTVTGMDFSQTDSIKCKFGEVSTNVTLLTDQMIQCVSPSHPPGIVSFSIESLEADAVSDLAFEFYKTHHVISAFPATGPYHGGTSIKVYGRHFRHGVEYTCYFGEAVSVPGRFVNADLIECTSPQVTRRVSHTVALSIAERHSNYTGGSLVFTYGPHMVVSHLEPEFVLSEGGEIISVFGEYHTSTDAWCRFTFDSLTATTISASFVDSKRIDCQVPPRSAQFKTEAFIEVSSNSNDWSASRLSFTYIPRPVIDNIRPQLGSLRGGTTVSISGSNFVPGSDLWCNFGDAGLVRAKCESSNQVYCNSPPSPMALFVSVSLQMKNGVPITEGQHYFRYHREVTLEEVYPDRGFVTGGACVTVFGTGFLSTEALSCHFGSAKVTAKFLSPTSIECISPPLNLPHIVQLGVSLNGGSDVSRSKVPFIYDPEPDFYQVVPRNVAVVDKDGLQTNRFVTISGSSFLDRMSHCKFGDALISTAHFISESELHCALPAISEPGVYNISIAYGADFSQKNAQAVFVAPALIAKIYPARIQEGSEVILSITGDNFIPSSDLRCCFGELGSIMTPATWKSKTTLECKTPSLNLTADGHSLVGVTNNGGYDVSASFPLDVAGRARFLSMYPNLGYVTGGTDVSIVIGNIRHAAKTQLVCRFDLTVVPAMLASSIISCVSPPQPRGNVTVVVMASGETQPLASGSFEYLDEPVMSSSLPSIGSLDGGTVLALGGSGFEGVTHCRFDDHVVPVADVYSHHQVLCQTPKQDKVKDVLVSVSHNGQDFASSSTWFSYRATPNLADMSPSFGSTLGGKIVYVSGSDFSFSSALACQFGESITLATFISETIISCRTPPSRLGRVPLSVSLNGVDFFGGEGLFYEAISLPQMSSLYPRIGSLIGPTQVIINTTALPEMGMLACHFGDQVVQAVFLSRNSLTCMAPVVTQPSTANVSISVDGERLYKNDEHSFEFNYVKHPVVETMSPTFGWTVGGTNVTFVVENMAPFYSHDFFCSFGGSSIFSKAIEVHEGTIVCTLPEFDPDFMIRRTPITISIDDGVNSIRINGPVFIYLSPAIVTKIEPRVGSVLGGTHVRLFGYDFVNMYGLQCYFGNIRSSAEWINENEVQCVSPEYKGGDKEVSVHLGIDAGIRLSMESRGAFKYLANPIIRDIYPRFGTDNGGTRVALSLVYPWQNAAYLSCRFGESMLVEVEMISDDKVACITPTKKDAVAQLQHGKQEVSVSLYAKHGQVQLATSETPFSYMERLEISSLQPNSGPVDGGTNVSMVVKGLYDVDPGLLTCHFGSDAIVPVSSCVRASSDWACGCTTPSIAAVTAQKALLLELGLNGLQEVPSLGKIFSFYTAPVITSIYPSFGFREGGELVHIEGRNFRDSKDLRCLFGDVDAEVLFVSSTELICTSPTYSHKSDVAVQVRLANNGLDFTHEGTTSAYKYIHRPDASTVWPSVVNWDTSSTITLTGKHLLNVTGCRYGDVKETYPALNVSSHMISCQVPSASSAPIYLRPTLSAYNVPIFLELENGMWHTGLDIRYEKVYVEDVGEVAEPNITSVKPSHGASLGGDWIRVYGKGFLNRRDMKCIFGDAFSQQVRYISPLEIHCMTPKHVPKTLPFSVTNGGSDRVNSNFNFTFLLDASITSTSPSFGSVKGGTVLNLYGTYPASANAEIKIVCKFGLYGVVEGELVDEHHIVCESPRALKPDTVELSVSIDGGLNFENSSAWFSYELESEILEISPKYGYKDAGDASAVLVMGRHFKDDPGLVCLFGETKVPATFITKEKVSCLYPSSMDMSKVIQVRVFVDGDVAPSSWKHFEYIDPPVITSYEPMFGGAALKAGEIIVTGTGFRKVVQLLCSFGDVLVKAVIIDSSILKCPIPSHPPGIVNFRLVDQYSHLSVGLQQGPSVFYFIPESSIHSIIPSWNASKLGALSFVRGTNFDGIRVSALATLSGSLLLDVSSEFDFNEDGRFVLEPGDILPATNGTYMGMSSHNLTLCKPGTFQPQSGHVDGCLLCPVGFICPLFGMTTPITCPGGFICSRLGLAAPSSQCVAGHYCLPGTKMASQIVKHTTDEWIVHEETGVVTASTVNFDAWDYIPRVAPSTGVRRIFHPPNHEHVTAQQPLPCPLGYYCTVGVSTGTKFQEGNFSTPQTCHDGHFCARGSISPEGTGACPTGYYCAAQDLAVICDIGHYCPGTGNTFPLPCFPGTYSSTTGQSNCDLCEIGHQCPGWRRSSPEPCQAGFVCDTMGLSVPEKFCPSGYYCEAGTTTDDPLSLSGKPPLPCLPGQFCLYGVAHRDLSMLVGLPSFDMTLPQPCAEGYYCSSNAPTPMGDGPCFPGHYCPPSSKYPIQVPPGSFADDDGSIVPSLCLPGTFSPRPGSVSCSPCPAGFSCLSYGTFVPRICGPGTYRSKADSIPCKLCPERTYSFESGLTDISQCLPCLEGRVCGKQGLDYIQKSDVCAEGHVCGYVTSRASQYDQKCIGGCFCGNKTTTLGQYSNYCTKGHSCERGTSEKLSTKDKCTKSHFCPTGTSSPEHFTSRCPRQTTSGAGSGEIESCAVSRVAICDKKASSLDNPFHDNSYYPVFDQADDQDDAREIMVVKKVLPFNSNTSNVLPWVNDTVEVFRACPSFGGIPKNASDGKNITVIGRNFRNSTGLTCRFRVCQSFRLIYMGRELVFPGVCEAANSNFSKPIYTDGSFMSENRVACPLPDFASLPDFQPVNTTSFPQSKARVCMHDEEGQMFLSSQCTAEEVSSGSCAFEQSIPSYGLRKRIYSLHMPCSEDSCRRTLNPCLAQEISVDISNTGKKFSGDATVVPYRSSAMFDAKDDSYVVNSTIAVYEVIRNESFDMVHIDDITRASFDLSAASDKIICRRSSVHEEGKRLIEAGWFRSDYMSKFDLVFDWRHIPHHIVYNQHFKLAIYVVPSRCNESKCNGSGRKHHVVENIPCLQPVELPLRFENDAIDKHQMMNLTLLSLDDALFKVEVQIMNGVALPMADFFKRTMTVVMEQPGRAKTFGGEQTERMISPLVSWDGESVPMTYIFGVRYDESNFDQVSAPMNLPPRWKSFERGRMLLSMNTTQENIVATVKDSVKVSVERSKDFWGNPYPSVLAAKEQNDLYFETFHGVAPDESGEGFKYDHDSLILPYLPYFSNCREFDSYIPLWAIVESESRCELPGITADRPEAWWRRQIPSLPHQDDVKAVGPHNFMQFYPVADWCERKLHCQFEENLQEPNVIPRWFEADSGTSLFSIIRDPIDRSEYKSGQKFIRGIDTLQTFIPAKVDRSPAFNVEGGCTTSCYPRKVTLDISYQQVDVHTKRIVQVKLFYDKFDKDANDDRYELQIKFYALNYQELVIKFAFSRGIFMILFAQIGVGTVIAAFAYWVVIRVTTSLEEPPALRISGFLLRIFPPAFGGVVLGLLPISTVTVAVYYLLKGHLHFGPDTDPDGRRWMILPTIQLSYSDASIDPDRLHLTRQGRTGLAFLSMSLISFYYTTRMFVPKRRLKAKSSSIVQYDQSTDRSVAWKRMNLVYSSILMSLFLVVIVEWSFWGSFGTYIWEAIIFMKILSMFVGSVVDAQLGEALLSAPVMTAMGMVQGIVTMSANDFMDFLLSYIVGFGFLIIERMYIGPLQADFITWLFDKWYMVFDSVKALLNKSQEPIQEDNNTNESIQEENNETLEPLLGSFANYSCDTLSLLYTPFIMVVIMMFRDEMEITKIYGIKEADMEYYVLFALTIIPFQIIADILLHNSLELLHGFKILDYLEYCRARFFQREVWWKNLESNTMDECIEESLRSIDQLCFSSQYYMLNTIHVNAMIYFVLGVEMMVRAKYNFFGDPAMIPIFAAVLFVSIVVQILMIWIGRLLGIWRVRTEKRNWHAKLQQEGDTNIEQLGDMQTTGHDLYQMELRITEETFRYKFLRYNRSWIINQLPDMLTPRITQISRPYMINQLARVLGSINVDISSDSDDDYEREFDVPTMSASTRTMLRTWMGKASRLLRLRKIVQPLIQKSRGNECEICLSRNLLQIECFYSIEQMDEMFIREYGVSPDDQLDQVLWKKFFTRMQRYQTICLLCVQEKQRKAENSLINDDRVEDMAPEISGSEDINETSSSIMSMWYTKAKTTLERQKMLEEQPHNQF